MAIRKFVWMGGSWSGFGGQCCDWIQVWLGLGFGWISGENSMQVKGKNEEKERKKRKERKEKRKKVVGKGSKNPTINQSINHSFIHGERGLGIR